MTLYEYRPARWLHGIRLVATLTVVMLLIDLVFLPDVALVPVEFDGTGMSAVGKWVVGLLVLTGSFLAVAFGRRMVERPTAFVMTDDGFEYSPAGLSTGWVKWSEVENVDYTMLKQAGAGGPVAIRVLGVFLREPAAFVARQPTALRAMLEARQYESGTPLVFLEDEFGWEHERIVTLMRQQVARVSSV